MTLPEPRPEYVTDAGHKVFELGDVVKLRDPLPETAHYRGVVAVIRDDWYVVWSSGEIQNFDDISGDDLIVLIN